MSNSADDPEVFWVEPYLRGIIPLEAFKLSSSLKKRIKKIDYEVRVDYDFNAVIKACAMGRKKDQETWINADIRKVYGQLFKQNICHTVEVYREDRLIGGLYGLSLGSAFFGESMFHFETDASKIALTYLIARLKAGGYKLLDTQFITAHLESLGAIEIRQTLYLQLLKQSLQTEANFNALDVSIAGANLMEHLK